MFDNENLQLNIEEVKRQNKKFVVWTVVLSFLCVVLIAVSVLNVTVFDIVIVDGTSMSQTLLNGDVLRYNKVNKNPSRDEIVIIKGVIGKDEDGNDRWIIKRVIGLPGDKVEIIDGKVYRTEQGKEREELSNYGHAYTYPPYSEQTVWELGENEIFYLGDNREPFGSSDSRVFGPCTYEDIVGVVPAFSVSIKGITTFMQKNIVMPIKSFLGN